MGLRDAFVSQGGWNQSLVLGCDLSDVAKTAWSKGEHVKVMLSLPVSLSASGRVLWCSCMADVWSSCRADVCFETVCLQSLYCLWDPKRDAYQNLIFEVRLWILFKFLSVLCLVLYRGTLDILEGISGGGLRIVASKWGTKMEAEFNTANLAVSHLQRKVAEVCGFLFYISHLLRHYCLFPLQ